MMHNPLFRADLKKYLNSVDSHFYTNEKKWFEILQGFITAHEDLERYVKNNPSTDLKGLVDHGNNLRRSFVESKNKLDAKLFDARVWLKEAERQQQQQQQQQQQWQQQSQWQQPRQQQSQWQQPQYQQQQQQSWDPFASAQQQWQQQSQWQQPRQQQSQWQQPRQQQSQWQQPQQQQQQYQQQSWDPFASAQQQYQQQQQQWQQQEAERKQQQQQQQQQQQWQQQSQYQQQQQEAERQRQEADPINEAFKALDLPRNATKGEVRKAYLRRALIDHPDKGGNKEKFQKIQSAKEKLDNYFKSQGLE